VLIEKLEALLPEDMRPSREQKAIWYKEYIAEEKG
jgi:hypothetical protein